MLFIKADTSVIVPVGPFVDVGDGFTPETGVTLSGADEAEIIKSPGTYGGAISVTSISARTWSAITGADGWYSLTLTTTDTEEEGFLKVVVQDDSVCLPVWCDFHVVSANVYNSLFEGAGTDYLDVNVEQLNATTLLGDGSAGDKWRG